MENTPPSAEKRLLPYISGFFICTLIISNILATKMIGLGPFVFDGGTLLFPFSYIVADLLSEVYGFKQTWRLTVFGFFIILFVNLNIFLISILPAASGWQMQEAFDGILMQMPRITLASVCGYLAGNYSNSAVLSVLKTKMKGRLLFVRTIGSTLVGELLDSSIFVFIAFWGLYQTKTLTVMALSNYAFKVAIEVVFTPITYKVIAFVKAHENIDTYDYDTDYNPFSLR